MLVVDDSGSFFQRPPFKDKKPPRKWSVPSDFKIMQMVGNAEAGYSHTSVTWVSDRADWLGDVVG
ncbi:MAG: hypothetical protein IH627_04220 [Rubrivivax sp.]|nr:hypothetical protein [Rubrivivax sp.]